MHMMGKRVNYAARSVITPDPNIEGILIYPFNNALLHTDKIMCRSRRSGGAGRVCQEVDLSDARYVMERLCKMLFLPF